MPPEGVKNATILIIDDQEANIDLLEGFLADEAYTGFRSTTDRAGRCRSSTRWIPT